MHSIITIQDNLYFYYFKLLHLGASIFASELISLKRLTIKCELSFRERHKNVQWKQEEFAGSIKIDLHNYNRNILFNPLTGSKAFFLEFIG